MAYNEFKRLNEQLQKYVFNEMVNWNQDKTGLPCIISFQTQGTSGVRYQHNGKRLKFQNNNSTRYQKEQCIPIDIETGQVYTKQLKQKPNEQLVNKVNCWIKLNKQILLNMWDGKITPKDAETLIKKFEKN